MDILRAMDELRKALAIKAGPLSSAGGVWDQQMHQCLEGKCTMEDVLQLLSELRSNAKHWARPKQKDAVTSQVTDCGKEQKASLKLADRSKQALSARLKMSPISFMFRQACIHRGPQMPVQCCNCWHFRRGGPQHDC